MLTLLYIREKQQEEVSVPWLHTEMCLKIAKDEADWAFKPLKND